ncbi:MAG: hypothetical protein CMJ54_02880 [Planctomycetaceae bacterium]|nr:hypothetical protein [Planctomycetaceae bacterium]
MSRPRHSHRSTRVLISFAAFAMLSACASNPAAFRTAEVEALHPDAVTEISIEVGTAITLMLPGNAGTGYEWVVAGDLPGFLRRRGGADFVAKDPSKVGSQGDTRFVFEATGAGEATLRFHYLVSWKKDARPARWAEAAITAKPGGG